MGAINPSVMTPYGSPGHLTDKGKEHLKDLEAKDSEGAKLSDDDKKFIKNFDPNYVDPNIKHAGPNDKI